MLGRIREHAPAIYAALDELLTRHPALRKSVPFHQLMRAFVEALPEELVHRFDSLPTKDAATDALLAESLFLSCTAFRLKKIGRRRFLWPRKSLCTAQAQLRLQTIEIADRDPKRHAAYLAGSHFWKSLCVFFYRQLDILLCVDDIAAREGAVTFMA